MQTKTKQFITPEEYLEIERKAECKSEYFNGEMFALAGAKKKHIIITTNIASELRYQLKKHDCIVYSSELRVKISETGLYTYPDVVVACGNAAFEDEHVDTLLSPTVIIEILSESTEAYDRGKKFEHYMSISSLQEYLLVSQNENKIEKFQKQEDNSWIYTKENKLENSMEITSISCKLQLNEVYDKVNF